MSKKKLKQVQLVKSNNAQYIFFIVIIGILLILVAYLFGKSQTPTVQNSQPSSIVLNTPTPIQKMIADTPTPTITPVKNTFNTQACINNAESIGQNCLSDCTNQANIKSQSCPTNDVNQHQNCLNQILLLNSGCLNDCTSTGKIAINNCRQGISP